jgi:hypothetical protein
VTYIAVPAAPLIWQGTMSAGDVANGTFLTVAESSDPNNIASASGTTITVARSGTYRVNAMAHTVSKVFSDSQVWRLAIYGNGSSQGTRFTSDTTPINGNQGGGNSRAWASAVFQLQPGGTVQVWAQSTSAGAWPVTVPDGNVEIEFIPTQAAPQPRP